jgi:uncharacterized protein YoxC
MHHVGPVSQARIRSKILGFTDPGWLWDDKFVYPPSLVPASKVRKKGQRCLVQPVLPAPALGETLRSAASHPKLLAILGTIGASALAVMGVLIGVVYGGIQKNVDDLKTRVEGLEQTFRVAVTAGISVQDLLARAPRLETTINDTRTDVATIKAQVQSLQGDTAAMKQQLQGMQQTANDTRTAVARIEARLPKPQ